MIVQSSSATQPQTVRTRGLAVILFPAEDGSVEDVIHNAVEHCSDVDGHTLSVTVRPPCGRLSRCPYPGGIGASCSPVSP